MCAVVWREDEEKGPWRVKVDIPMAMQCTEQSINVRHPSGIGLEYSALH